MEIKDRLIKIISSEGLTSAAFADSIGVQRSSISHIVSGRNNPSLDFLQKILASFPKYNAEWLLMGIGEVYKVPKQSQLFEKPYTFPKSSDSQDERIDDSIPQGSKIPEQAHLSPQNPVQIANGEDVPVYNAPNAAKSESSAPASKRIHKIVIFYEDKSFGEYHPESH